MARKTRMFHLMSLPNYLSRSIDCVFVYTEVYQLNRTTSINFHFYLCPEVLRKVWNRVKKGNSHITTVLSSSEQEGLDRMMISKL